MLKKSIKYYYNLRITKLTNAIQDLSRYNCLYGDNNSLHCQILKLYVALENFKLELFKGLPYVTKIINN